jgi:hypothetical protein
MMKYTKLKSENDWMLQSNLHHEMTLVSEFDFKGRYVYPELEHLFVRTFETEILDNCDII